jgi:hypothetical protein
VKDPLTIDLIRYSKKDIKVLKNKQGD